MDTSLKAKINELNIEIGNRLKMLRESKGLSQVKLIAELADYVPALTDSSYSRYECGETSITPYHLDVFCDYFNVTVDYLVNGTEKTPPDEGITKILNLLTPEQKKVICSFMADMADCMGEKQPVPQNMQ